LDTHLLDLLACPECGSEELFLLSEDALTCTSCGAHYRIRNGIPRMLPARLAAALARKEDYPEMPRPAAHRKKDTVDESDPEADRFMWEHKLYDWGKEVIYRDAKAAAIFESYAEKGARDLCHFIEHWADGVEGKNLLYVGSGNDRMVSVPLEVKGSFLVNLDVATAPLQDLTEAGVRNCVCGDARRLPFRSGVFDVVFSKGSVPHSHPIDEPLLSMARVTRPGGHIIVAEPNKYAVFALRLPSFLLPSGLGQPTPYERALSAREVKRVLARDDISQFEVTALTHAPAGMPLLITRMWERLGKAMPWLMDRFAFEFILCGQKA